MNEITSTEKFDTDIAEKFTERLAGMLNDSAIVLMLSVGHRVGLFSVMSSLPPSTSEKIAEVAGLNERYLREWLAAMTTGRIVTYDARSKTFVLPANHAASLTPDGALGNIAVYAQFIAMSGAVQDTITDKFKNGGGLQYEDYPHFHQIMAEDSAQTVVGQLFDTILPLAEGIPERLEVGIDVLDAGCGSGKALIALAERFPKSRFVGYDLSPEAVAKATQASTEVGLKNIKFRAVDLTEFDEIAEYDFITSFDAIHDQKDPQDILMRLAKALRPDGVHLMQDVGGSVDLENNMTFPMAAFLYTVSSFHCMPVSLGQGGAGLGTMWGWETAEEMLLTAGFSDIARTVLPHDPMNVWFVSRLSRM